MKLSTREAADLAGVTPRTVRLWIDAGSLPYTVTGGGHIRIVETDLIVFLAAKKAEREARNGESTE